MRLSTPYSLTRHFPTLISLHCIPSTPIEEILHSPYDTKATNIKCSRASQERIILSRFISFSLYINLPSHRTPIRTILLKEEENSNQQIQPCLSHFYHYPGKEACWCWRGWWCGGKRGGGCQLTYAILTQTIMARAASPSLMYVKYVVRTNTGMLKQLDNGTQPAPPLVKVDWTLDRAFRQDRSRCCT